MRLLEQWWFWAAVVVVILVALTYLPLWTQCGKMGCWKVNLWESRFFVMVD